MADYDKLKVADLKELIKERGIPSTGLKLKQHFIDALIANDAEAADGDNGAAEGGRGAEEQSPGTAEDATVLGEANGQEDYDMKDVVTDTKNGEAISSEGESANKRKRRSPTPPLTEENINKKLKTAEEQDVKVKLPEDLADDLPPTDDPKAEEADSGLYDTRDDTIDVKEDLGEADQTDITGAQELSTEQDSAMEDVEQSGPPSRHPPTRALYIRELVRPLQPNVLREHLLSIAQPGGTSTQSSKIESFHLDKLRSHALVLFDAREAAIRARTALHAKIWPDEPMRRTLWVDFVPEESVQEWIDAEVSRADMTRWEVVYSSAGLNTDGPVTAVHQEADSNSPSASRKPSQAVAPPRAPPGAGEGMPNAPSGPRQRSTQSQAPPTPKEPAANQPSRELDAKFYNTSSKPKIYFKPVGEELMERRMAAFDQETSRDWNDADADPSAYAEGELRRYTFEDGDRLVDGGADFGLFGRRSRGGARGGGRGRGGDYYRGGPRRR